MVTSKKREDIAAEIEQAERLGVLVVTREDLERVLDRTMRLPTADEIYEEAIHAVRTAQAKYEAQPTVPLPSDQSA
jgi:hypothetical protein